MKYMLSILTLTKKSKKSYYENFLKNNFNDLKSTWKGIRNLISMTESTTSVPNTVSQNDESMKIL